MAAARSTLQEIREAVREMVRSPSPNQLSDDKLDQAINTVLMNNLPNDLRLRTLKTVVTWYTQAYMDTYKVDKTLNINDPLYDFENRYITLDSPVMIDGWRSMFSLDRDSFFGYWPQSQLIEDFATGNGTLAGPYIGSFSGKPIMQRSVIFSCIDVNYVTWVYCDVPTSISTGNLINQATNVVMGTVNYITGAYSITFEGIPAASSNITRQSVQYTPGRTSAILYHNMALVDASTGLLTNNSVFTVRPIPNKAYQVSMEAYRQPMQLLSTSQSPELNQWWEYIAYHAAMKILNKRLDQETVAALMPELLNQRSLVIAKTYNQNATQRAATPFSAQLENNPNFGSWTNGQFTGPF